MSILKDSAARRSSDPRIIAGDRAESQMAFYLRRSFGEDSAIRVLNDLRLTDAGDAFQIDHLVLHRHGAIIIESKSVTTRVRINALSEWERYFNGVWGGMPSPIAQARLQGESLRRLFQKNRESLRRKLAGFMQTGFGHFSIEVLVAISDSGAIERHDQTTAPEAMKADFVCDRIRSIIARQRKSTGLLGDSVAISEAELQEVTAFLLNSVVPPAPKISALSSPSPSPSPSPGLTCSKCGSSDGSIQHGRFGYYWKCAPCGGNSKLALPGAGRLRKDGATFTFHGEDGTTALFHTNAR